MYNFFQWKEYMQEKNDVPRKVIFHCHSLSDEWPKHLPYGYESNP